MSSIRPPILLRHPDLHGFQYGMLRDFEGTIVRMKSALVIDAPPSPHHRFIAQRLLPTTRYRSLLNMVPKWNNPIHAEELWSIQMGPEGYPLWHYRSWDGQVGRAMVYLFDTLRNQFRSVQAMVGATRWDDLVTSFPMAVPLRTDNRV
jgi:hypothetical protein